MTTTQKTSSVVGLFDTHEHAERAVRGLVDGGIDRNDISLVANSGQGTSGTTGASTGSTGFTGGTQKTADGTTVGENVAGGALFGGLGGLLIGLGALAIPGIGPIVAAGPIAATLAGMGIGAAGGGMIGAMKDAGVPDDDANIYAEGVRQGGTLVIVRTDSASADRASSILDQFGAVDVDERGQQYRSSGWSRFDESAEGQRLNMAPTATPMTTPVAKTGKTSARTENLEQGGERTIPVVQEELQVGKRAVERGGVRVYSHVTEQPVQESVSLREESVKVERRPVDRPVTDAAQAFQETSIEVRETDEVPVVSKQARVVEEVVVGKEVSQRTEQVSDTVRRTDVQVEQMGGTGSGQSDAAFRTHYQSNFAKSGKQYDFYAPAYQYGTSMSSDARYKGKSYANVESDLRRDYEQRYPGSTWQDIKDAVRHGWENVTGRR